MINGFFCYIINSMGALIKIIIKVLAKAAGQIAKNSAIKSGGLVTKGIYTKSTTGFTQKALLKMAKSEFTKLGYRAGLGKAFNAFFAYSKAQKIGWKDALIEQGLGKNSLLLKKAHVKYRGAISKAMTEERNRQLKLLEKLGEKNQRLLSQMELNGVGIDEVEATFFQKYFQSLNDEEKKSMKQLLKDDMIIVGESSGIAFGLFIPYGSNRQRGVMALQLYGSRSRKNPSLFYSWVRVKKKDWEIITMDPRGKSFGDNWYRKNRLNQYHLTAKSKYKIKKVKGA